MKKQIKITDKSLAKSLDAVAREVSCWPESAKSIDIYHQEDGLSPIEVAVRITERWGREIGVLPVKIGVLHKLIAEEITNARRGKLR